tara:strand:+ start:215 stop:373 length:159 start_codon:yes stop_codon:yes gene_type:complete
MIEGLEAYQLHWLDYTAFGLYFVAICAIGLWVGRKEKADASDYFLAGRGLPC